MSMQKDFSDWNNTSTDVDVSIRVGTTSDDEETLSFSLNQRLSAAVVGATDQVIAGFDTQTYNTAANTSFPSWIMISADSVCTVTIDGVSYSGVTFMIYAMPTFHPYSFTIENPTSADLNVRTAFLVKE